MKKIIDNYYCNDGAPFIPCERGGMQVIGICDWLVGTKFDETALCWLEMYRPSVVRIRRPGDSVTKSWRLWRVTIVLDENDTVMELGQEVRVGLCGEMRTGNDLQIETDAKILRESRRPMVGDEFTEKPNEDTKLNPEVAGADGPVDSGGA